MSCEFPAQVRKGGGRGKKGREESFKGGWADGGGREDRLPVARRNLRRRNRYRRVPKNILEIHNDGLTNVISGFSELEFVVMRESVIVGHLNQGSRERSQNKTSLQSQNKKKVNHRPIIKNQKNNKFTSPKERVTVFKRPKILKPSQQNLPQATRLSSTQ
jgi:hypothetical protein